jgi:hypothetical protein
VDARSPAVHLMKGGELSEEGRANDIKASTVVRAVLANSEEKEQEKQPNLNGKRERLPTDSSSDSEDSSDSSDSSSNEDDDIEPVSDIMPRITGIENDRTANIHIGESGKENGTRHGEGDRNGKGIAHVNGNGKDSLNTENRAAQKREPKGDT